MTVAALARKSSGGTNTPPDAAAVPLDSRLSACLRLVESVSAAQALSHDEPEAALIAVVRAAGEAFDAEWAAIVVHAIPDRTCRVWAVGPNRRLITSPLALPAGFGAGLGSVAGRAAAFDRQNVRLPIDAGGASSAVLVTSRVGAASIAEPDGRFARVLLHHAAAALRIASTLATSADLYERVHALEAELARSRNDLQVRAGAFALTSREAEVLRLLGRGRSNRDIATSLFVSESTAKFHVANIMRKLEVRRRAEAVYVAGRMGVV